MRALVVRAVLRDFLRAGAEAGYGHEHFETVGVCAAGYFAADGYVVIEQGADAGDGGGFAAEEGEGDADSARFRAQEFEHLLGEVCNSP